MGQNKQFLSFLDLAKEIIEYYTWDFDVWNQQRTNLSWQSALLPDVGVN